MGDIGLADLSFRQKTETFVQMAKKQLIVMTRYPVAFVSSFAMIFILMLTFILAATMFVSDGNTIVPEIGGRMMYGFILFLFLTDTLWNIGFSIREEQYQGTLESFYLTPVNKFSNLVSRVFVTLVWTGLNAIVGILIVSYMFGNIPVTNVLLGFYLLFFSLLGTFGIGFTFAAVALKVKESVQLMINFLSFFFMIVCAMFFPFSALPDPMVDYVSKWIPVSYCVDAFRSVMSGIPTELAPLNIEIWIVTIFGILMPIIGYWLYRRIEVMVRKEGTLAEY